MIGVQKAHTYWFTPLDTNLRYYSATLISADKYET